MLLTCPWTRLIIKCFRINWEGFAHLGLYWLETFGFRTHPWGSDNKDKLLRFSQSAHSPASCCCQISLSWMRDFHLASARGGGLCAKSVPKAAHFTFPFFFFFLSWSWPFTTPAFSLHGLWLTAVNSLRDICIVGEKSQRKGVIWKKNLNSNRRIPDRV